MDTNGARRPRRSWPEALKREIVEASFGPGASVSLVLAYLSYELFEKRFLKLKRLFETAKRPAPERPAAVAAAGP